MIAALLMTAPLLGGPVLVAQAESRAPTPPSQSCSLCHGEQKVALARSVHTAAGFTCVSCHGGDPRSAEAAAAHAGDFRPLTDPEASVLSCGECHADVETMRVAGLHSDPLDLYRTSRHGQALFENGDTQVATCTDCHGSHAILRTADPNSSVHPRNQAETCGACHGDASRMEPYGLSSDAPSDYQESVHGRAVAQGRLASPACTDCHGHHGALPPGIDEAEQVCGHCHAVTQEDYELSAHFRLDPTVQCITCHGNHRVLRPSVEALVGGGPGSCSSCHRGDDDPGRAVAKELHAGLVHLKESIAGAAEAARRAGQRGGYLDDQISFLAEARGVLVRARSRTHAASTENLERLLVRGHGMVARTEESLERLSRRDRDRRIFTAVFFALTAALAIMLLMYAREFRGSIRGSSAWPESEEEDGDES